MLKLSVRIEITGEKKWVFEKITACEIVRDSDALTTTCKLTLPRKVKWQGETSNPIRRGDKISVWLGYDDNLQLAFSGYVLRVGLKAPIEIFCEDEMFMLKNLVMDYSIIRSDMNIRQVLEHFTSFPVRTPNFDVGYYFRSSAVTAAQFLSYIKSASGCDKFFFREIDGEMHLVCLNQFVPNLESVVDSYVFETGVNLISDKRLDIFIPGPNNVYVRIPVLAAVNGNKVIVERGSQDKAIKKFIFRNQPMSEATAVRLADFIVARESQSGLKGSFTTFGVNLVWPFDIVGIKIDGERKGKYQVAKNTITYGSSGFRQDITLGARAAE